MRLFTVNKTHLKLLIAIKVLFQCWLVSYNSLINTPKRDIITYQKWCAFHSSDFVFKFIRKLLLRLAEFGLYAWWPNCH